MPYKFLIIGGLHGNEPLGIELVKKVQKLELKNVKAVLGNPEAVNQNVRFIESDLNRVFGGDKNGNLEQRRAVELINYCKDFDFVIDFHNTHCPGNDCGFVGGGDYQPTLKLASFLCLKKVIIADYDCINKYVNGCLSVEISLSSKFNSVDYWLKKILSLDQFDSMSIQKNPDLYKFIKRLTTQQQQIHKFQNWQAFVSIPTSDRLKLDLDKEVAPIFVNDPYTPYNFAGLIESL